MIQAEYLAKRKQIFAYLTNHKNHIHFKNHHLIPINDGTLCLFGGQKYTYILYIEVLRIH